ncbi:MAG: hypothetical protein KTR26_19770 [Flammeovirgaceae bacterium]|nr:hypothetical protein [Flammeovirgaceae bacterium]
MVISIITSGCSDYLPFCLLSKDCGHFPSYYITDRKTINNGYKVAFKDSIQLKVKTFLFYNTYPQYPITTIKLTVFNKNLQDLKFFPEKLKLTSNLLEYNACYSRESDLNDSPIVISPNKNKRIAILVYAKETGLTYKEFKE